MSDNTSNTWQEITAPYKYSYDFFKGKQLKDKDGEIFTVTSTAPVVFGSTMNDGNGIKLRLEDSEGKWDEGYIYQNGTTNYFTHYRNKS